MVLLGSNGATFKEISNFWGLEIGIPDIDQKSQIVHEQFGRMLKKLNRTTGFELGDEVAAASAVFVQDGYPVSDGVFFLQKKTIFCLQPLLDLL